MGPTLFVHLPQSLSADDKEAIDAWLSQRTISLQWQGIEWEFNFTKDNCTSSLAIVPFGAESAGNGTATDVYMEEDERLEYEIILGYCPVESIQLDNFCRSDASGHQMLAQLAAHLARQHNGLINVGGAIGWLLSKGEIINGKWYALNYSGTYESHLVDADFMEEWSRHPNFGLEI